MTRIRLHDRPRGAAADFAEARLAAVEAEVVQQRQAAHRVAEHCHDVQDCRDLLEMLGLSGLRPRAARPMRDELTNVAFPEALGVSRTTEGVRR